MPISEQILEQIILDRTITELDLQSQNIDASDIKKLVKALTFNPNVKLLNLHNNPIGDEGALALAQCDTLTSLDVSSNNIGSKGAQALAKLTLTTLDIYDNQIGDEGAIALAQNATLEILDAGKNQIGDEGAEALAKSTSLSNLELVKNQIGPKGAEALYQNLNFFYLGVHENLMGFEEEQKLMEGIRRNRDEKKNQLKQSNQNFEDMGKKETPPNSAEFLPPSLELEGFAQNVITSNEQTSSEERKLESLVVNLMSSLWSATTHPRHRDFITYEGGLKTINPIVDWDREDLASRGNFSTQSKVGVGKNREEKKTKLEQFDQNSAKFFPQPKGANAQNVTAEDVTTETASPKSCCNIPCCNII